MQWSWLTSCELTRLVNYDTLDRTTSISAHFILRVALDFSSVFSSWHRWKSGRSWRRILQRQRISHHERRVRMRIGEDQLPGITRFLTTSLNTFRWFVNWSINVVSFSQPVITRYYCIPIIYFPALYGNYSNRNPGLRVLAFPCNQFKNQEPGKPTYSSPKHFVKSR